MSNTSQPNALPPPATGAIVRPGPIVVPNAAISGGLAISDKAITQAVRIHLENARKSETIDALFGAVAAPIEFEWTHPIKSFQAIVKRNRRWAKFGMLIPGIVESALQDMVGLEPARIVERIEATDVLQGLLYLEDFGKLYLMIAVTMEHVADDMSEPASKARCRQLAGEARSLSSLQFDTAVKTQYAHSDMFWSGHALRVSDATRLTLMRMTSNAQHLADWDVAKFDEIHCALLDCLEEFVKVAFPEEADHIVGVNFMYYMKPGDKHWPSIQRRMREQEDTWSRVYPRGLVDSAEGVLLVGPTSSTAIQFKNFLVPVWHKKDHCIPGSPGALVNRRPEPLSPALLTQNSWPSAIPDQVRRDLVHYLSKSGLASCISLPVQSIHGNEPREIVGVLNINSDQDVSFLAKGDEYAILQRIAAPLIDLISHVEVLHRSSNLSAKDQPPPSPRSPARSSGSSPRTTTLASAAKKGKKQ